jgi:hypothetical protein
MSVAAVVIPVYHKDLNAYERISLRQCVSILGRHPLVIVKPDSLDLSDWLNEYPMLQFESFNESFFKSIRGYNELLCSESFYNRFLAYEYILVYQLDAFVMRDSLLEWCRRGYDYVGAPQFSDVRPKREGPPTLRDRLSRLFQQPLLNGGLSLRRVKACRRLLRVYHLFNSRWPGNEDGFFSLHYPRLIPYRWLMRMPAPEEAIDFAIELEPNRSLTINEGRLPMGCHAWHAYDLDFWRPILNMYGYEV